VVDSSPKIVPLAADFDEDLIQVPLPLRAPTHRFRSAFPDFVGEVGAKSVDPQANAFVANIYAALVKKVLDISKREREPDIHQHGELDNLWRGFEVAKRVLGHFLRLNAWTGRLKVGSPDNTHQTIPPELVSVRRAAVRSVALLHE